MALGILGRSMKIEGTFSGWLWPPPGPDTGADWPPLGPDVDTMVIEGGHHDVIETQYYTFRMVCRLRFDQTSQELQ